MGAGVAAGLANAMLGDVQDSLTASGTSQDDAQSIGTAIARFGTVASGTGGILPAGAIGDELLIINAGANSLNVYPPVGHAINAGSTNAAISVATSSSIIVKRVSNLLWIAQDASQLQFIQSGSGATTTSVQTALRLLVHTSQYDTAGNYNTARDALTGTFGMSALQLTSGSTALSVGPGGAQNANAVISMDGGSNNDYGCQLRFSRNSVQKAVIGNDSSIFTGSSDDLSVNLAASVNLRIYGNAAEQVRISPTASATRYITLTGSNGGAPIIGTSAGNLRLSSAQVLHADGSGTLPSVSFNSFPATGLAVNVGVHGKSLSFCVQDVGEAMWINGSGQLISTIDGTAAIPQYSFSLDGGTGSFLPASDIFGIAAGTTHTASFNQTTTSDASAKTGLTLFHGGGGSYTKTKHYTQTAIAAVAKTIHVMDEFACWILVAGNDGTNFFLDELMGMYGSAPLVKNSFTQGSPTARTYTVSASSDVQLVMASGTYDVNTFSLQLKDR